ncbi:type II secretion system protein GspD [Sulfurovum sp.]|uniref:type II secretion system protein GspD n=1 Tax=Sulfurovum sp. TaxID=1969726 RepID=UPI003568970E
MHLAKLLILIPLLVSNLYCKNVEVSLKQFIKLVSVEHNVNILVSEDIETEKVLFYINNDKEPFLISVFKRMLFIKGYILSFDSKANFYYIQKKENAFPLSFYSIKLDAPLYEDLKITLDSSNIKHSYISSSNTLSMYTDFNTFENVSSLIEKSIYKPKQFMVKMTITETNLNDIKDRGTNLSGYIQNLTGDLQYFINLFTMPLSATTNVFEGSTNGYYAVLKYLNESGNSELQSSPFMTVQSGKEIYFSSVQNIPYKTTSTQINGASSSTSETTAYKDVGLKIKLKPQVVDDVIYCTLNFTIENILDQSATPTTSKRQLDSSFQLKAGQLLVLSGINSDSIHQTRYGIPLIEKIPILGDILSFKHQEKITRTLAVTIEIIEQFSGATEEPG